ncbi:TetR/AcrR family transcriptional regulator [Modestobacter sp. VKM Ac-2986]|uniref:TetR/AcrR family transcriptional regulator n=1 Tax=Modestobacter sp. VKM Ac-2986 TaxID=3004140 RepID=UPI0022AB962D|nr:TetR/AcrR family transcriptional regulator [Modestobacter sp. VKM Ac-2986]MCZ2831003.1 TetR/AcrR family transcriptional regulator [Modestobacter sp. VKM Ac-2986]
MPKSAYHHGDLRSALLEVTAQLVREKGARGFSVSEAARRVGVSIAAPYRHFDDREAMLAAVATRGFTELQETLDGVADPGDQVVRAVAIAEAYVGFALADTARFEVMFAASIDKDRHPELLECAGRVQSGLQDALRELVGDDPAGVVRRAAELWSIAHGVAALLVEDRLAHVVGPAGEDTVVAGAVRAWATGLAG